MALAKYFEEIGERWLTNTSARYEAALTDLFNQFPPRPAHAGEVYLTRSERRMEDTEVCKAGDSFAIEIVSTPGTAEPTLECEDETGRIKIIASQQGRATLHFDKAGTRRVQVTSGGYVKPYVIHVVHPFQIEQLPDFAQLVHSLAENPPKWTEKSFEVFRMELRSVTDRPGIPTLFADGILEYHIALYHEERRLASFRDRFQAAYGALRWFIPYSDIARLVCTYFLFCANEFSAAERLSAGSEGRLRTATQFFLDSPRERTVHLPERPRRRSGLPLLIAQPDVLSFQSIEAIADGRPEDATELAAVARQQIQSTFDKERYARLSYLEARLNHHIGDTRTASAKFETLTLSPWESIAAAARRQLSSSLHG